MTAAPVDTLVRDVYSALLDAWNRRSADEIAALFAADGTLVGFDGSVVAGHEIYEHLAATFADHLTATYVAKVRGVREVGPNAALLRAIVGMVPRGGTDLNPTSNAHQTLLVERRDDAGQIVLFQNTPAQYHGRPHLVEQHTTEIRQLIGEATT